MKTFLALLSIMAISPCFAQFPGTGYTKPIDSTDATQSQDYWRGITQKMLNNARNLIRPTLRLNEREIEGSIEYIVPSSGDLNAVAYRNAGRRYIRFGAGSSQIFGWIASAESMAIATNNERCFLDYMSYLSQQITRNTYAMRESRVPSITWGPAEASEKVRISSCRESADRYRAVIKSEGEYIARQAEASFMLLWLHEVGHHVLGHVDTPDVPLDERRRRESAADAWAVEAMARANQFPSVGRPFFYLLSAFQAMSPSDEQRSTHPIGARRSGNIFKVIVSVVRENEQLRNVLRRVPGGEAQFFSDLDGMEKQANQMLSSY